MIIGRDTTRVGAKKRGTLKDSRQDTSDIVDEIKYNGKVFPTLSGFVEAEGMES